MENNLTVLEAKVLEAVDLIKDLRRENARLTQELATAREQVAEIDRYEEKRQEVENKVGGLLAKLEALG